MINNTFLDLKEVIVGKELNIPIKKVDFTFKYFFNDFFHVKQYNADADYPDIIIDKKKLEERHEDLDGLANTLTNFGVKVHRPDSVNKITLIQTKDYKTIMGGAGNIRDCILIIGNNIIETPPTIRSRIQENELTYDILYKKFHNGYSWIKAPTPRLLKTRIDTNHWSNKRDFTKNLENYDIIFDAAQCLFYKDTIVINVGSYNHYLGYLWLKNVLPNMNIFYVSLTDNHIDGLLNIISDGVFLANPIYTKDYYIKCLPDIFKDFKFIFPEKSIENGEGFATKQGMDVNVLSVNSNTVIVNDDAYNTINVLEQNKFNVIPIQMRNNQLFAGGIHCSTLELERDIL